MHCEMVEVFCGLKMSGATELLRARAKQVRELCRGKGGGGEATGRRDQAHLPSTTDLGVGTHWKFI